jgi:hypothetical protein
MTEPVWVRLSSVPAVMARAMPKSATFTAPFGAIRTLPGFTSRCTTPLRWAKPRAAATSAATMVARRVSMRPSCFSTSERVRFSTYSITM